MYISLNWPLLGMPFYVFHTLTLLDFFTHGILTTDGNNTCLVPCFIFMDSYCPEKIKIQEYSVYPMHTFYSILLTSNLGNPFPPFDSFQWIPKENRGNKQAKKNISVYLWLLSLSSFSLSTISKLCLDSGRNQLYTTAKQYRGDKIVIST